MIKETYGIVKWLQKRNYSQLDIQTTIYRYGAINNVKQDPKSDYMNDVCLFIQSNEEGFAFFTSWVKTYEQERTLSRKKSNQSFKSRKNVRRQI